MARKKPTSRAAAKTTARKTTARKTTARKTVAQKNATQKKSSARKGAAKSTARKKIVSKGRAAAPAKPARPRQRIAISHHREEDFKTDGLRAYATYRDLGIKDATDGLAQAHVIRLVGPCNPEEVSKLHFHDVDFQMVFVLKGWVKTYMEGHGEEMYREHSSWTQPPKIKHMILDYSDDVELLEIILPADFETVELTT